MVRPTKFVWECDAMADDDKQTDASQQVQSGAQKETADTSATVTAENFQLTESTLKKSLDTSKFEKR